MSSDLRNRPNLMQYLTTNGAGEQRWELTYRQKYASKPPGAPFKPGRFDSADLTVMAQSKKPVLNPRLGLKPSDDLFAGIEPFNRKKYNFQTGVSDTSSSPVDDVKFDPEYAKLYEYSPVIPPEKKISNPMPTAENPDPKGYLAAMGENKLKGLLDRPPSTEDQAKASEKFKEKERLVGNVKNITGAK
jgi:hypothetical protein